MEDKMRMLNMRGTKAMCHEDEKNQGRPAFFVKEVERRNTELKKPNSHE
jgi:hypothetical protein